MAMYSSINSSFVVPGQPITSEPGFLRGHGTYYSSEGKSTNEQQQMLIAANAGYLLRVNKLISVKPVKSRYIGEVGDLIVGRIRTVDLKKWKVDIAGQRDAVLHLSAVNLPGGVQRMRTYEDQLSMRTLFAENDLVSAEIQNISSEGVISIHTRSYKYGRLENGQLIVVPCSLVKRLPQHYISLPENIGVDVILGKNGFIWITRTIPTIWRQQEEAAAGLGSGGIGPGGGGPDDGAGGTPLAETLQHLQHRHNSTPLLLDERVNVTRVRNCIHVLASRCMIISPESILAVCTATAHLHPKDIVQAEGSIEELLR